jgi:alkylation response protein AidB-like acyl-CoA dehydrogenase
VLPTLIVHGTSDQQQRFVGPTLRGEQAWCQLFSEPGAGSDLAALATKAARTDGGWLLSGQKVWTSMAREAQWGICLARTNPTVPKHEGITCFLVEMSSDGIDIRPLRELTGMTMFNEVFLSDVFVPDECVVGAVDDGWAVSRTTLANERVSMGAGSSMGPGVRSVLDAAREAGLQDDASVLAGVGRLLAESHGLAVMGLRATLRSLAGADPGPESSVRKLLGVEHDQRVQEMGLELLGPRATTGDGRAEAWITGLLFSRCLTIAGGTSEIQRNVIAERLLGLPKDA